MAFVRSSLKTGSSPGPTPTSPAVKVLDNGEISTESSYATANFTESIANYEYIVVIFRRYGHGEGATADESHKTRGYVLKVSDIVDNGNTIGLYWDVDVYGSMNGFQKSVSCTVTLTSIACYNYSGAYNKLCCDVYAYPTGTLRYPD